MTTLRQTTRHCHHLWIRGLDRLGLGIQAQSRMMQEIREGLALPDWNGKVPLDGLWGYYSDSRYPDVRYYGFRITNGATGGVDIAETETVIGVWWRLVRQRGIIDALMYRQWFRFLRRCSATDAYGHRRS